MWSKTPDFYLLYKLWHWTYYLKRWASNCCTVNCVTYHLHHICLSIIKLCILIGRSNTGLYRFLFNVSYDNSVTNVDNLLPTRVHYNTSTEGFRFRKIRRAKFCMSVHFQMVQGYRMCLCIVWVISCMWELTIPPTRRDLQRHVCLITSLEVEGIYNVLYDLLIGIPF